MAVSKENSGGINMNKKLILNFVGVCINFYLLPLVFRNTSNDVMMMLIVMPLITIVLGVLYTYMVQPHWIYPVVVALLFIPTMWLYYSISAWIFAIIHFLSFIVGCLVGIIAKNMTKSTKSSYLEN